MRRIALVAACLLPLCRPVPSAAYDRASAVNIFIHEVLTCVAYHTLRGGELRQAGDGMDAYRHFVMASDLLGRARTMLPEARLRERLDRITARMTARMAGGEGGDARTVAEYADICRRLDAAPEARLKYWMDKR